MSTVVIILCFLLTGTTSFEYMLNSYERFEDVLTGLPCDPSANIANLTRSEFEESLRDILRTQNKTEVKSQCVKELYLEAVPSALGSNETYLTIVTYTSAVLFTFLPLILLTTFNCFLIAAVHNSTRIRRNMTNSRKSQAASIQENKMTVTLIAVVVLFLVCQTPTAIFMLYKSFVGDPTERRQRNLRLAIGNILNCLVIINASCNFILYCALSAKYRQTVKDILFRRGRLKRQNTTHTRLSRCVSRATDENGRSWRGGGGNSRTPSFQADARQKLNSYSRTPSFTLNNNSNARRHSGRFGLGDNVAVAAAEGPASGDRNRTSSISEKHQSINASDIGNYLTDDVNRKYSTSSNTRLAVPQSSRRGSEAAADGTTAAPSVQKKDSLKMTEHLLRSSQSSASLTRSQSLMFPEQPKHSPTCKAHPLNK